MSAYSGPADWWTDGTDSGRTHITTKGSVQDGLVLNLDAGANSSYPDSGTTWTDLSENTNNGTLVNGVEYLAGYGGSLVFDGVDDYVGLPHTSLLDLGSEFTISAFCKNLNKSSESSIFACFDVTTTNTYTEGFYFHKNENSSYGMTANSLRLQYGKDGWGWNVYASNGLEINDNNWHHVCVTASNLNTTSPNIVFYIDGEFVEGTRWTASSTGPIRYASNTDAIRIGSVYSATRPSYKENYSNINAAHVSVYDRALSSGEVQQNFNAIKGRFGYAYEDRLLMYLDAGIDSSYQTSNNLWYDLSLNKNNSLLFNSGGYSSDDGGSLVFDGVDDYAINLGFTDVIDNFSIVIWCKPTATHEIDTQSSSGFGGITGQRYIINPTLKTDPSDAAGTGISVGTNGVSVYEHADGYLPPLLVHQATITQITQIVIVYTNKQPSLYLNGVLVKTGLTSPKSVYLVGEKIGLGDYGAFQGNIFSVKYYDKSLTSSEIQDQFNNTRGRYGI